MRLIAEIRLCDIKDPVVWRRVALPMELTFDSLHLIFQAAMGWENQHLYSFKETRKSRYFEITSPHLEESGIDATRASASKVLWSYFNQFVMEDQPRDTFFYLYDFGDDWLHEVSILELDRSDRSGAELLDGGGACPPENCGGHPGYARMKDYLNGKMSKKEYYDWMTAQDAENWDVHHFDLKRMKLRVKGWKMLR